MSRPYVQLGEFKIAPFKDPKVVPYGPFVNATEAWDYPVKQSITIFEEELHFNWPSAEHTFHAQKIIHFKSKLPKPDPRHPVLTKILYLLEHTKSNPNEEFLPHNDYEGLIKNLIQNYPSLYFGKTVKEFEMLCDANYHPTHAPHQGLMENGEPYLLEFMRHTLKMKLDQNPQLKDLAIDCALEGIIPVEVSHHDNYWASGPEGKGHNKLGIIILELGYYYLEN